MIEKIEKKGMSEKEYRLERYQIMRGAQCWESIKEEYELAVECDGADLLIMLDTRRPLHRQGVNYRRHFSMAEDKFRLKQFDNVTSLFEAIKDENICTVNYQEGVLTLKIPAGKGNALVDIELEKKDLNEYYRIELEFRRLARRQFDVEKELREQNQKTRKGLEEQKKQVQSIKKQLDRQQQKLLQKEPKRQSQEQAILEIKKMQKEFRNEGQKNRQKLEQTAKELKKVQENVEKMRKQNKNEHREIWEELRKFVKEQELMKNIELPALKKMEEEIRGNQEIMGNKLHDLLKEQNRRGKKEKANEVRKGKEDKRSQESLIMRTPDANCFTIDGNTITRSSGEDGQGRMVLLDVVAGEGVFSFRTHVHTIKGNMFIGVTSRVAQKEKDQPEGGHSICYGCDDGTIYYVTGGDDGYQCKDDSIGIREGMELLVEVEKCEVRFTVLEGGLSLNKWQVNPILRHPGCQFVPFFALERIGDRVSWELQ